MLKEENLSGYVEEYLQTGAKLEDIGRFIAQKAQENTNPYASIKDNYPTLLIYCLIQKQVPIEDFAAFIKNLYKQVPNMEPTFDRFFNYRNTNLTLQGYMCLIGNDPVVAKQVQDEWNPSIWDKLYYTFLLEENKKPVLNKQTLPYLLEMLKAIGEKEFKDLQYGKFSAYCGYNQLAQNPIELKPIFDLNNPAFNSEKTGEYYSLSKSVISYIASESYELSDEENKEKFHMLSVVIPNFKQVFLNTFLTVQKDGSDLLKLNNGVVNFARYGNIDLIPYLVKKYQELYEQVQDNKKNKRRLNNVSSSISVYFEDFAPTDFTNLIDPTRELAYNLAALCFLALATKNAQTINMTVEQKQYVYAQLNKLQDDNEKGEINDLYFEIEHEKILTALNYMYLNEHISASENKTKTRKI